MDLLNNAQSIFVTYYGRTFHKDEVVLIGEVLECYPQGISNEQMGVPLRATAGIQSFFDKVTREYRGVTFYAPPDENNDNGGEPWTGLKYVLAVNDGTVKYANGQVILITSDLTFIYSNFTPVRWGGNVKKGQILGYVNDISDGLGYGVSIQAYSGGNIVRIEDYIRNIPYIE